MEESRFNSVLPTSFQSNHASNIVSLKNGDLLCAWFGGSREGHADVYILLSRLKKGTSQWTDPTVVSGDPGRSEQNPVLFPSPEGKLWLFYTAQLDFDQGTSQVRFRISEDEGHSWSEIHTLFDIPGSFIRQPLVVLDNGDWLFPMYYSKKTQFYGSDYSAVKISADQGKTWVEHTVPQSAGLVHMNVLKTSGGSLTAFFRSRWADRIYRSCSGDSGRTWSIPAPTLLPNNNASIQAAVLKSGHIAVVFNNRCSDQYRREGNIPPWMDENEFGLPEAASEHLRSAVWGTPRVPLTIALSEDGGETWPYMRDLETDGEKMPEGDPKAKSKGEYSYPSIFQTQDGTIHITYTYLRDRIKYVRISEDWIRNKL